MAIVTIAGSGRYAADAARPSLSVMDIDNGWKSSAEAWIADMGEAGDFPRRVVLDPPMVARVSAAIGAGARRALDVGCGEGRFCRMMSHEGLAVTGIDPTRALLDAARIRDPQGTYVEARAEAMPFDDEAFDLVVSYLSLIDIAEFEAGLAEMVRVLRPGGRLLLANLSSFATALPDPPAPDGWLRGGAGPFGCDRYHEPRAYWVAWRGIRVRNWHRPMEAYMRPLIERGMILSHFAEPAPPAGPETATDAYRRAPLFVLMEWQKPRD